MNIKINDNTKIYVLCPAYKKTGGPELAHQLVKELNENQIEAYITYFDIKRNNNHYTPNDFKKYINESKTLNDIEDLETNIIISPEVAIAINITKKFKNIRKIIWWMSVDNFLGTYGVKNALKKYGIITTPILIMKKAILYDFDYIKTIDYHFCQSYYAIDFLKKKKISNYFYLSDYINDEYFKMSQDLEKKEDIILFNPKKGFKYTKRIINKAPYLNFIPLKNLTTKQVKQLLLKSKVYIDFGNHPGKDRLPREAAICNCCIITNYEGSARYKEDVPIDDEFKFENNDENIEKIISKINCCLNDYENEIQKFENYRKYILNEPKKFKLDVKKIFIK